jgi:hypothetical protein
VGRGHFTDDWRCCIVYFVRSEGNRMSQSLQIQGPSFVPIALVASRDHCAGRGYPDLQWKGSLGFARDDVVGLLVVEPALEFQGTGNAFSRRNQNMVRTEIRCESASG